MKSSALSELLKAFKGPPPGPIPSESDWLKVERLIGRPIPEDYKVIVRHTGGCCMGHCVLRNPAEHDNVYASLSEAALNRDYILKGELAENRLQIQLFPEPSGWVQLAGFDRIDFLLKHEGDDIAIADYDGSEVFDPGMKFAELMLALFKDRGLFDGIGASNWHDSDELLGWV